jgi:hypothetical protein
MLKIFGLIWGELVVIGMIIVGLWLMMFGSLR